MEAIPSGHSADLAVLQVGAEQQATACQAAATGFHVQQQGHMF